VAKKIVIQMNVKCPAGHAHCVRGSFSSFDEFGQERAKMEKEGWVLDSFRQLSQTELGALARMKAEVEEGQQRHEVFVILVGGDAPQTEEEFLQLLAKFGESLAAATSRPDSHPFH
jgi:hypothetical protein